MLDNLGKAAIVVAALGQTAFVLVYATRTRWRQHFVGRALFTKSLSLMLLVDVAAVNIVVDYPGDWAVTVALYWLVAVAIWVQLAALAKQLEADDRAQAATAGRDDERTPA